MYSTLNSIAFVLAFTLLLALTVTIGCDDNGSSSDETVTFEGKVTDDPGFGKRAAAIEGAAVTASNVDANGSLRPLAGEATTNAEGEFTLEVDGAGDVVVLTAEKESFSSDVMFYSKSASSTRRPMPMTVESQAEAAVYVESIRSGSAGDLITVADVAAFVNSRLAAEWKAEATTVADILATLETAAHAQADYFEEDEEPDADEAQVREHEIDAFVTLQASLNTSADASAQASALREFERSLIDAYTEAGASLEAQAKARHTARAALIHFFPGDAVGARFALQKQAEILTSLATCLSIEESFESAGVSEERLEALAASRINLLAAIRAASNDADFATAQAAYEAEVEVALMTEIGVDAALLTLVETALTTAKTALDASVEAAGSTEAIATAYSSFYTTGEASVEAVLEGTGNAGVGAQVMTLLTTH